MNALWLAFFHNKTTVRLRPSKHLHEHREAAHLGEHLPLVGQRLLTAINTLSTWNRDPCLNRSVTALRTLQITCFGELDVRDYATTEKIWESKVREKLWMEVFLAYFLVIWPVFSFFLFFFFGVLCRPLLLLPSFFPSIKVFSNESALCIGWPKYWSFSFSISPSNEYSGLISFRIDSSVLESDYPG